MEKLKNKDAEYGYNRLNYEMKNIEQFYLVWFSISNDF